MSLSTVLGSLGRVLLVMCLVMGSSLSLARGGFGGGDFHQGGDQGFHQDNGYHDNGYHDDGYVGSYHPGDGYGADPVILNAGDGGNNCQTVQQCDSDGNCATVQNCD